MKITFSADLQRILGLVIVALLLFISYLTFFNHVDVTHVGIARNRVSGETWLQQPGWYLTAPWTQIARIDTRPMRVTVTTAGHGFSAKLIQFQVAGWKEFVTTEGFHYYWWYNRISFNFGYKEEYRGFRDIMRGYAYGAKQYSFIKILEEYK